MDLFVGGHEFFFSIGARDVALGFLLLRRRGIDQVRATLSALLIRQSDSQYGSERHQSPAARLELTACFTSGCATCGKRVIVAPHEHRVQLPPPDAHIAAAS